MAINRKHYFTIVGVLIALISFFHLGNLPLIDSDEAHYARVFHEASLSGDFLSFTKRGEQWMEKPPLYFWFMAGSVAIFGENEFAMRLPSASFLILSIILTYLISLRLSNDWRIALFASLILLTTGAFISAGRQVRMDVPVTAAILFSLYMFLQGLEKPKWLLGIGIGLGTGVLLKSVIGLLPIPLILIAAAVYNKWDWLKSKYFWLGVVCLLIIALPWHIYEWLKYGSEFFNTYFGYHILQRFAAPILGSDPGFFYYISKLSIEAEPWTIVCIISAILFFLKYRKDLTNRKSELTLFLIIAFIFSLFTISRTKLFYYLVPIYPFMAIFIAITLPVLFKEKYQKQWFCGLMTALFIIGTISTIWESFAPETFDNFANPSGVVSKHTLAQEEKIVGGYLKQQKIPVYYTSWPYQDTLTYYGDAPEFILLSPDKIFNKPYFFLLPTAIYQPNSNAFELIYKGHLATLLRTR